MNPHFRDILAALFDAEAEFLVIGAYALAGHGLPRAQAIWISGFVRRTKTLSVFGKHYSNSGHH